MFKYLLFNWWKFYCLEGQVHKVLLPEVQVPKVLWTDVKLPDFKPPEVQRVKVKWHEVQWLEVQLCEARRLWKLNDSRSSMALEAQWLLKLNGS